MLKTTNKINPPTTVTSVTTDKREFKGECIVNKILFNDRIIERENVIDIEDRGYQFGDGVYEVIGVYGGKMFMLDEHMERLKRSADEIQLKIPLIINDLKNKLRELVLINNLEEGIIYLQITRGVAPRWHTFPDETVSPVTIAYVRSLKRMTDLEKNGVSAILTEDIRWLRCDIKTLNLLPNVLSKQKAVENSAFEAIMHRKNIVTEASSSNVFIVKNEELFTHPANNFILNGITRKKVIQLCEELNLKVNEETFTVDTLLQADEVFITATKLDIIPVVKVNNQPIGTGKPGNVTKKILHKFQSLIQPATQT
jgi:D-alanine transaminase